MKTIGILGGMGPRATVMFEQMLLDRLIGADQQLPTIITINDGSIPDRSQFLIGSGIDPLPQLQRNVQSLEQMGAEIIAVPCNSASMPIIFDRLQTNATLLNLPELVVGEAHRLGLQRLCLLATEGTIRSHTYQRLCRTYGIACIVPSTTVRREVTELIHTVKRGDMPTARSQARLIAPTLGLLDCDGTILGCTELPLVRADLVPDRVMAIDTLAILADTCVKLTKGVNHAERSIHH